MQKNRLFASYNSPYGLFYSDDSASTWNSAFPRDSIFIYNEQNSWGNKVLKVLANNVGWVIIKSANPEFNGSNAMVNYNNGTPIKWNNLIGVQHMKNLGFGVRPNTAIHITDKNLYAGYGTLLIKKDSTLLLLSHIIDVADSILAIDTTYKITNIAAANNQNGYPYFLSVALPSKTKASILYKNDGTVFSNINLPANLKEIHSLFTLLSDTVGDTLILSGIENTTLIFKNYASFDQGITWQDISFANAEKAITDIQYSPKWKNALPQSNGNILIINGEAISEDLGANWEVINSNNQSVTCVLPSNHNYVFGSDYTIEYSNSGASGNYFHTSNINLSAFIINDFDISKNKRHTYVATQNGIGFTGVLYDTSITASYQKWASPNGAFPLASDSIGFSAIAIDLLDTLHVVAGFEKGFYVTKTGYNGFYPVFPSQFYDSTIVKDIYVYGDVVLAVTALDTLQNNTSKGEIWKSNDGGDSWVKISPTGFSNGRCIASGMNKSDTVLLIGTGLINIDTGKIWRSDNWGGNWTEFMLGPTSITNSSVSGLPVNDIEFFPGSIDTFYVVAGYEDEYSFANVDFVVGVAYNEINLPDSGVSLSLAFNSQNPDTIYVSQDNKIFKYISSEDTSIFYYEALPGEQITDLRSGSLLCGTSTGFYSIEMEVFDDIINPGYGDMSIIDLETIISISPNPNSGNMNVNFYSEKKYNNINMTIYDIHGKLIYKISNLSIQKGENILLMNFNNYDLPTGKYFINLSSRDMIIGHSEFELIR